MLKIRIGIMIVASFSSQNRTEFWIEGEMTFALTSRQILYVINAKKKLNPDTKFLHGYNIVCKFFHVRNVVPLAGRDLLASQAMQVWVIYRLYFRSLKKGTECQCGLLYLILFNADKIEITSQCSAQPRLYVFLWSINCIIWR